MIGYIGKRKALPVIIDGLKKLEYRGYDSAGVATINKERILITKRRGKVKELEDSLNYKKNKSVIGIGHTRWATHGKPSSKNAHPHADCSGSLVLVHNGIIENYLELKAQLKKKGCKFKSDTDTEVVAHLIASLYKKDLKRAVYKAQKKLKGAYALCIMDKDNPEELIAVRNSSPLAVGVGEDENFVISDISAVLGYTNRVIYLDDFEIAVVGRDNITVYDKNYKRVTRKPQVVSYSVEAAQRGGFKHFMLKEINEQPAVFKKILQRYVSSTGRLFRDINFKPYRFSTTKRIKIVACGTAYYAGLVGKYFIEKVTRIPVSVELASEFRYSNPIVDKHTLVCAISQSGETADTLAAVRLAKKAKAKILAICNVVGSSLTREADAVIYTCAGPEISVASTKAYTAQLSILYLLGLYLAEKRKSVTRAYIKKSLSLLKAVPAKQKKILKNSRRIKNIAKNHLHFGAFLYLGRNINFPTALEGALKLKEISYIPAEGYAAGEMKHGPIALIDEYRAVVCVATESFIFDKMASNIQEILARKGKLIVVASDKNQRVRNFTKELIFIPKIDEEFSPLLTVMPLQLFAYFLADLKGYDVDKPRNLAKSVTVE